MQKLLLLCLVCPTLGLVGQTYVSASCRYERRGPVFKMETFVNGTRVDTYYLESDGSSETIMMPYEGLTMDGKAAQAVYKKLQSQANVEPSKIYYLSYEYRYDNETDVSVTLNSCLFNSTSTSVLRGCALGDGVQKHVRKYSELAYKASALNKNNHTYRPPLRSPNITFDRSNPRYYVCNLDGIYPARRVRALRGNQEDGVFVDSSLILQNDGTYLATQYYFYGSDNETEAGSALVSPCAASCFFLIDGRPMTAVVDYPNATGNVGCDNLRPVASSVGLLWVLTFVVVLGAGVAIYRNRNRLYVAVANYITENRLAGLRHTASDPY